MAGWAGTLAAAAACLVEALTWFKQSDNAPTRLQGHTMLIENMGESVDAVLMPVITRATYKKVSRGGGQVEWRLCRVLWAAHCVGCCARSLVSSGDHCPPPFHAHCAGPLAVPQAGRQGGGVQQGLPPAAAHQGIQPAPGAGAAGMCWEQRGRAGLQC